MQTSKAEKITLRARHLVHGSPPALVEDVAIDVANGLGEQVNIGVSQSPEVGAPHIDFDDRITLLPGLIDLHTHLTAWAEDWAFPADKSMRYAVQGVANLSTALSHGVTTVRDLGSHGDLSVVLREAVNAGVVRGPRVIASRKAVTVSGGLGATAITQYLGPTADWMVEADGADALRWAVREQIREGAEWIKLYLHSADWTTDEVGAVVDTAHALGIKVAAHAVTSGAVKRAITAGVDTIEHGIELDDDDVARMAERHIGWVPTLSIVEAKSREDPDQPNRHGKLPQEWRDRHRASFARAMEAGVRLGAGGDCLPLVGDVPFAAVAEEAQLMVELGSVAPPQSRLQQPTPRQSWGFPTQQARSLSAKLRTSSALREIRTRMSRLLAVSDSLCAPDRL